MVLKNLGAEPGGGEPSLGMDAGFEIAKLGSLTTKQHAVLQLLVDGQSNNEICARMDLALNTVKSYVKKLMAEFGAQSRYALALKVGPMLEAMTDEEYGHISDGLPKDWSKLPKGNQYDELVRKRVSYD